jgi:hypothetical protein
LVGWLVGWLVDLLVGWLLACLVGWLVGWLGRRLVSVVIKVFVLGGVGVVVCCLLFLPEGDCF